MKFILNVSVDLHFCALFDADGNLVEKRSWAVKKRDGEEVFEFLQKHDVYGMNLTFLGGVSGPGGFTSLRVGAGILNALAVAKKMPVHQVRADVWISAFLKLYSEDELAFCLNSFSDGVFHSDSKKLQRITTEEASIKFQDQKMFVAILPENKRELFKNKIDLSFDNAEIVLLDVLKKSASQKLFMPDYEFPAV